MMDEELTRTEAVVAWALLTLFCLFAIIGLAVCIAELWWSA